MISRSPFNVSLGAWNRGPDISSTGEMSYSWAKIAGSGGYYMVTAEGPSIAAITVVGSLLARYYASSDTSQVLKSGHTFYTTYQTFGVSVDEAIEVNTSSGPQTYYPINTSAGASSCRIVLMALEA